MDMKWHDGIMLSSIGNRIISGFVQNIGTKYISQVEKGKEIYTNDEFVDLDSSKRWVESKIKELEIIEL
jgi:hypothetical protein